MTNPQAVPQAVPQVEITLASDAVDSQGNLDPRYSCDLDNSSPELRWTIDEKLVLPAEFAVIAEDLDATGPDGAPLAHWLIYGIPGSIHHLPAGIPPQETLPNGIRQGINSLNKLGYTGPCPPLRAGTHRYVFRLYVLKDRLELPARAQRAQIVAALAPLTVATHELPCRYARTSMQRAG